MPCAKIAIVHPQLAWGGSELTTLLTIDALKDEYQVCLVTGGNVNLVRLNEHYGTHLSPNDLSILQAPLPPGMRATTKFAGLRGSLVARFCKRIAPQFDLMISIYNPIDFGVPGIQLIADFSFDEELRPTFDPAALQNWKKWWYGKTILRKAYLKLCHSLADQTVDGWKKNLTLANSKWAVELMRQRYGIEADILHPPIVSDFPVVPYAEREEGFVCLGRLVPEKRMDVVIEILAQVRQKGYDIHLHILGEMDDSEYAVRIKQLALKHQQWVFMEGRVGGQRKMNLIASHKYGINGRAIEPFGMAVGEMVKAGCIVFAPDGGGQVEIVDHPDLIFKDVEDAVQKIERVLSNAGVQDELRKHLSICAQRFSVEGYQQSMREIVQECLRQRKQGNVRFTLP